MSPSLTFFINWFYSWACPKGAAKNFFNVLLLECHLTWLITLNQTDSIGRALGFSSPKLETRGYSPVGAATSSSALTSRPPPAPRTSRPSTPQPTPRPPLQQHRRGFSCGYIETITVTPVWTQTCFVNHAFLCEVGFPLWCRLFPKKQLPSRKCYVCKCLFKANWTPPSIQSQRHLGTFAKQVLLSMQHLDWKGEGK